MLEGNAAEACDTPKKWPTLSTSTSSFEALNPHDPNLSRLATKMFEKASDYLSGELTLTQEDFKLLEEMNRVTASKYSDLHIIAGNLNTVVGKLDNLYEELQPYLEKIDAIEVSIQELENAAFKLDSYSKKLETKMNYLIKR